MSPLIGVAELRPLLGTVTLLDVRYRTGGTAGPAEFEAGHLPGAVYVDLDTALAAEPGPRGRHPLPDPEVFAEAMRAAGVDPHTPVVVYDDWAGRAAARAWWLLRHHGHDDVRVLDGGWAAWQRAGGEIETGPADPRPGTFTPAPGRLPVIEAEDVLAFDGMLVDARSPERYRGDLEPIDPVAGHIPNAVNVPTETNLRADGTFRSADELRALYAAAGVSGEDAVAAYCGSGVTAAHDILALTHAGIEAALYPGSWSEWVADPRRPVATATSARP